MCFACRPSRTSRFSRNRLALTSRERGGSRGATFTAEFDRCLILVRSRQDGCFADVSRSNLHDVNGIADYIGGTLLTFGTFGHILSGKHSRNVRPEQKTSLGTLLLVAGVGLMTLVLPDLVRFSLHDDVGVSIEPFIFAAGAMAATSGLILRGGGR
jgi:hypothetical protein